MEIERSSLQLLQRFQIGAARVVTSECRSANILRRTESGIDRRLTAARGRTTPAIRVSNVRPSVRPSSRITRRAFATAGCDVTGRPAGRAGVLTGA